MFDMRRPDDTKRLAHLLWETNARSSSLTDEALRGLPLTAASAGVLDAIAADPGTSVTDLTGRLPTSQQAVSQIVARLGKLGFLERRIRARGRGIALFVTDKGERARERADDRLRTLEATLRVALGPEDHDILVQLLWRARDVLERCEKPRTPSDAVPRFDTETAP